MTIRRLFRLFSSLLVFITLTGCVNQEKYPKVQDNNFRVIFDNFNNSDDNNILVVAHRGDWRNAPENSLQAIKNAIDMGVDIIELDVRLSKDSVPILMHDKTLDRTTNGKGKINNWTLDSLKTLHLKNGLGRITTHKIPTLEEALKTTKDKVLVNLDKCYNDFNKVYETINKTDTQHQVILKAYNKKYIEVKNDIGVYLDSIIFMPIINLDKQPKAYQIITDYQKNTKTKAFEIVFSSDTSSVLSKFKEIRKNGSRVWVNSLWKSLNAGYDDDSAVINPDSIYGWHINKGFNMIQTDRPQLLLEYLREKGLHD